MYLSRLELINKCNQNIAVPTINIPKPRRFKVVFVNIQNKPEQFPQISINVEAFIFTNIQRREHKIAKPRAPEWKEVNERSSAKTSLHAHMFTICLITNNHETVPVYWPWHAPSKIKWGGHFGVLTGMWIFQPRTLYRETNSGKP